MQTKAQYIQFCQQHPEVPSIFEQPWWLDATTVNKRWDVSIQSDPKNKWTIAMPFVLDKRRGITQVNMPALTPYLGPVLWCPDDQSSFSSPYTTSSFIRLFESVIHGLPTVGYTSLRLSPELPHGLPFAWQKFILKTLYSYQLELNDIEEIYSNFKPKLRHNLKQSAAQLTIEMSDDVDLVYDLIRATFNSQGLHPHYTLKVLKRIHKAISIKKQGQIFVSKDAAGQVHGAQLLIWDKKTAYNSILAQDLNFKSSGTSQYLLWHSIRYAYKLGLEVFDFEGGMIPSISSVYRVFRGHLKPYLHLSKSKNLLFHVLTTSRNYLKK